MATSSSERRPLLGETDAQPNIPKHSISRPYLTVVAPCFILYVSMGVMINLYNTAADQIAEGIICRNIHGHIADPMNDPRCKAEAVQSELSLLNGFQNTFELIPSVLCVLPYGMAADKYGRKKLFILNNMGGILQFLAAYTIFSFPQTLDIRLTWLGSLLDFVGGGQAVFEMLSYAMVSDAAPVSMRSTTFFWLSAAIMVGRIVAGPLTLFAMDRGEWFALRLSVAIYILIILASFFVKETHKGHRKESESEMADDEAASSSKDKFAVFVKGPVVEAWTSTRTLFASDKKVAALLSAILFTSVGKFVTKLLLRQYIAKRFHFTWAKANFVLSMNYFVQLGLVVGLLPCIATMLLKAKFSPLRKDAIIARGSLVLAVSGHFLIATAFTVPFLVLALAVYALGEGFDPALRSLIVSASTSSGAGTVLSTIVLMESIGLFIAGPIMAGAFRTGLHLGGGWIGLPFFISGTLATIGASIVFGCRFGNNVDEASQDDGEAQA